ncbi:hypothetical protein Desaci_4120 [Desulfosporosinus acidiphilus SJ4]|uniref:Uncharacterized protein n=1 Tax=Desulfosporosinus acidiphilus (strain DSM 22704 / JCM 16185 / SJ4) TaxID=646529 RepID=I4DB08_DESAJ|nr:hypothetical protein Desaci_4120 [Desulfosporosinus acidiphilus SJ4]
MAQHPVTSMTPNYRKVQTIDGTIFELLAENELIIYARKAPQFLRCFSCMWETKLIK